LTQIATIDAEGGTENLPTEALDRNSRQPRWSADGSRIFFLLEDDQSVQLAEVRLRDNRVERLTAPGRVVHEFDVNADGRVAMIVSTPEQPAEVWKLERGRMQQLSRQNDDFVEEVDLLSAQTIRFDSADGLEIHGMVMRPASAKAPLPLVLRIHGGPVSQYQYEFDFEWQLFAANGYLVAGVNPRGSTGRGEEFQKMLFADWGHADVPDILAATDHLVASHGADPDRLGVGGWSYGGILTNYVIASTDRFKAAISGSGMSNMLGGYGIDQYVVAWEKELGTPWENTDAWLRLSYPFLKADRIKTPTLFMCGAADFNVPLAASEQMYQALRSLDVPTELIIYPDQYHSLTRASFQHDKRRRYLEWYDRYLKP
jgi:dipeptidyl aminopeptidase/acylaminoacyl peptidase